MKMTDSRFSLPRTVCASTLCALVLSACGGGGGAASLLGSDPATAPVPLPDPPVTPVPDPTPAPSTGAPLISAQPASQAVAAGAAVTLSVTSGGAAPLAYQWTRNGVPVAGATAASYTLPSAQPADNAAVWRVVVRNALGAATSAPALLTVGGAGMRPLAGLLDSRRETAGLHTFDFPVGIVGDGKNGFYVSASDSIQRVSAGGQVTRVATVPGCVFYQGAVDKNGDLFVPCYNAIYKVTQLGAVSLVAGNQQVYGNVDGIGAAARFSSPAAVAFDSKGILYVADGGYGVVRKIDGSGRVTTFVGNPALTAPKDGTGPAAGFGGMQGIVIDAHDLIYVSDSETVRTITPAGVVTTLAGQARARGWADGAGAAARFNNPRGLGVDAAGNVYLADTDNNVIRKITPGGDVSTVAGRYEQSGSADGAGSLASFAAPFAVAAGSDGNLYVADTFNDTVRRVTPAGVVSTLAGTPTNPASSGSINGLGQEARFDDPRGIVIDAAGNLLLGDFGNHDVRKISPSGDVTTVAGFANSPNYRDGMAPDALFYGPDELTIDGGGNVYLLDKAPPGYGQPNRVRRIAATGAVTTVAMPSDPLNVLYPAGSQEYPAVPTAIAADAAGNLYVGANATGSSFCTPHIPCSSLARTTVRKIAPDGTVTTLAASPHGNNPGSLPVSLASYPPAGMAVDGAGNVYLADTHNHRILKIAANGAVTTLAGSVQGAADGQGAAARFSSPTKLVADAAGSIYVLDSGNYTVRKIAPDGMVTTVAGTAGRNELVLGVLPGSLTAIGGIALDGQGNLYVTLSNGVIRMARP
ncbi:MAG: hypothetical protein V4724_31725 [Pseudomonadota bacterium]